ncbi:MAG: hypothetical protein IPI37_04775 [Bacteroidales bacterium]|nr:hypothetical protein [Bacteroidales bacterium]
MEDVGNLIFYILLGIIALVGSFQGKGKKKSGKPGPVQRQPGTLTTRPPVKTTAQTARPAPSTIRQERQTPFTVREERPVPGPSPWTMPAGQIIEGRYEEPMARDFSREETSGMTWRVPSAAKGQSHPGWAKPSPMRAPLRIPWLPLCFRRCLSPG